VSFFVLCLFINFFFFYEFVFLEIYVKGERKRATCIKEEID